MPTHLSIRECGQSDSLSQRWSARRFISREADLPEALAAQIWEAPYELLASGKQLHKKLNCTVVRISEGNRQFVFKHQDSGKFFRRVKKSLSPSPARRSWDHGRMLWNLGIPTPRHFALLEKKFGPFQTSCFLLTDYIPGTTLYRMLRHGSPSRDEAVSLAGQLADLWELLDSHGICHNDFKPENLLVDEHQKLWLIDFDRLQIEPNPARRRARQMKDLQDLLHLRSWRTNPMAAECFREALLRKPAIVRLMKESAAARELLENSMPREYRHSSRLTVLIPCRNAVNTIVRCIESVLDIADEVLVADFGSTDRTLERVRELGGCRIIQQPENDAVCFSNWAQSHVQHGWTLRLLPEEQLNPELGRQVQDMLASEPREDGFLIARAMQYEGRRLDFGNYPRGTSLRLFRSDRVHYAWKNGKLHAQVPAKRIGRLKSRLICELCPVDEGRSISVAERSGASNQLSWWRVTWPFLKSYLLLGGCLEGRVGLNACLATINRQAPLNPKIDHFQRIDLSSAAPSGAVGPTLRRMNSAPIREREVANGGN